MNKRGFELAINTIILLVLGILVLLGLFLLFVTQIDFFKENIFRWQTKSNVDTIISVCDSFIVSEQLYNYCCEIKKVNTGEEKLELTCEQLSQKDFVGGRISNLDCSATICDG